MQALPLKFRLTIVAGAAFLGAGPAPPAALAEPPSQDADAGALDQALKPASLDPDDLKEFDANPPRIRALLEDALELTSQKLSYKFGSADPEAGGMDCSGAVYYLLRENGWDDAPRSSHEIYRWAWQNSRLYPVAGSNVESFQLEHLKPGDLLFWSGTYKADRDPPITHVMIYLGEEKESGRRVMVGSSDGRSYAGRRCSGVSVFDFKLPSGAVSRGSGLRPRFIAYGPPPDVEED